MKLPRTHAPEASGNGEARQGYEALRLLQTIFQPGSGLAALTALGCFEIDGYLAVATRWFDGVSAAEWAVQPDEAKAVAAYRAAGMLLRKLHDALPGACGSTRLDVEQKIAYLLREYRPQLQSHRAASNAFSALQRLAHDVATTKLKCSRVHGDFKPENVLYNGQTAVTLDAGLAFDGPIVYDIASFLEHTSLTKRGLFSLIPGTRVTVIQQAFLDGYGKFSSDQIASLRWARLYSMLCYFSMYRKRRSIAPYVFSSLRIAPLLEVSARQLEVALSF